MVGVGADVNHAGSMGHRPGMDHLGRHIAYIHTIAAGAARNVLSRLPGRTQRRTDASVPLHQQALIEAALPVTGVAFEIPLHGSSHALAQRIGRHPTEPLPAFPEIRRSALDPNRFIQLAPDAVRPPVNAGKDLLDQVENRMMPVGADIHDLEPVKRCAGQCHAGDGVLDIGEVSRLQTVSPNRKGIEAGRCLGDQRDYRVAFVFPLAICRENAAGNATNTKLQNARS